MSVVLNARGTSIPYFGIGKGGVVIYQGTSDPSISYTIKNGDYWFDSNNNSIKVYSSSSTNWIVPRFDNLTITGNTITADSTLDLILQAGTGKDVVINPDDELNNGVITTNNSLDLIIDPTIGGGGRLVLGPLVWPLVDGTTAQLLGTNGAGYVIYINNPFADFESRIAALESAVYALQHP